MGIPQPASEAAGREPRPAASRYPHNPWACTTPGNRVCALELIDVLLDHQGPEARRGSINTRAMGQGCSLRPPNLRGSLGDSHPCAHKAPRDPAEFPYWHPLLCLLSLLSLLLGLGHLQQSRKTSIRNGNKSYVNTIFSVGDLITQSQGPTAPEGMAGQQR